MTRSAPAIGWNRTVKLAWLDLVADLAAAGKAEDEITATLRDLLREQLSVGSEAKRGSREKTITLLIKTWVRVPKRLTRFRDRGLQLIRSSDQSRRLALHWGMVISAYPFFGAVAEQTGRLLKLHDRGTAAQVQRRIKEAFGQRETAARSARYVLRAFVDWGVMIEQGRTGIYTAATSIAVDDDATIAWLIEAILHQTPEGKMPAPAAFESRQIFPFALRRVSADLLSHHADIEVIRHGMGDELLVLKHAPFVTN